MKPLPDTTEAEIAKNTTDKVYQRGVDYYEQGSVLSVVRRGDLMQAEVEGSEDDPYLVSIVAGPQSVKEADCTCPYGEEWSGWCKHIVATLLFCLNNGGEVEERPPLKTLLRALDREQLQALVEQVAANYRWSRRSPPRSSILRQRAASSAIDYRTLFGLISSSID